MNKLHLLHEAEKLYSVENLTPEMIAEKLNDDIDNNRILNKHEICALENIIKIIYKEEKERTKDLDNISHKKKFVKFLTPDIIEEINREILGWNGAY